MNTTHKSSSGGSSSAHHTNFIEALKSAGGTMVKDTGTQILDSVFGGGASQENQEQPHEPFDFNEYLNSGENPYAKQRQHDRVKQMYDQKETVIFNRRNEEVKKRIEEIQHELKRIAREIVSLDLTTQRVIDEEVIDPGVYHMSFFEKMLSFLQKTRKRLSESRHWAAMSSQRGQSKSYYWQQANAKKGGTSYSLSQERQLATQTG